VLVGNSSIFCLRRSRTDSNFEISVDRIHRIGQKRKVRIIRFVMKDSIEERMVALQEAKSMQAKGAMQKLKADEQKKARLSDLKSLLLLKDVDDAKE
jgi:SNF2 family DNA or RNA helicase